MERIAERLPEAALVSVGHRPELEAFHDRRLVLARRKDGARLVADEPLSPQTFALRRAFSLLFGRPSSSSRAEAAPPGAEGR